MLVGVSSVSVVRQMLRLVLVLVLVAVFLVSAMTGNVTGNEMGDDVRDSKTLYAVHKLELNTKSSVISSKVSLSLQELLQLHISNGHQESQSDVHRRLKEEHDLDFSSAEDLKRYLLLHLHEAGEFDLNLQIKIADKNRDRDLADSDSDSAATSIDKLGCSGLQSMQAMERQASSSGSVLGSFCPFSSTVQVDQYTNAGLRSRGRTSNCLTFANKEFTCVVSVTDNGLRLTTTTTHGSKFPKVYQVTSCGAEAEADEQEEGAICVMPESGEHMRRPSDQYYDNDMVFLEEEDEIEAGRKLRAKQRQHGLQSHVEQTLSTAMGARKTERSTQTDDEESPFLNRWEGCYSDEQTLNTIYVGISIGSTLFARYGNSVETAFEELEKLMADVNLVYVQQFNIKFSVRHVEIAFNDANPAPSWDNPGCSKFNIEGHLDAYGVLDPSPQGIWHLLDDCFGTSGSTIGIAYVNVLCRTNSARGVSYFGTFDYWLTIAHEIGHNFGMGHSFEEGQGRTGGIMDYGDGSLDGVYQFNKQYREQDVCGTLSARMPTCISRQVVALGGQLSTCGNGIVEPDEECECPNGENQCECCNNCQLRRNAECDPSTNECCKEDCTFQPASQECETSSGAGYCRAGICQVHFCSFCGVQEDNACGAKCLFGTNCIDRTGQDGLLLDGALCSTLEVENGACNAGSCVERQITIFEEYEYEDGEGPGGNSTGASFLDDMIPVLAIMGFAFVFFVVVVSIKRFGKQDSNDPGVDEVENFEHYTKEQRGAVVPIAGYMGAAVVDEKKRSSFNKKGKLSFMKGYGTAIPEFPKKSTKPEFSQNASSGQTNSNKWSFRRTMERKFQSFNSSMSKDSGDDKMNSDPATLTFAPSMHQSSMSSPVEINTRGQSIQQRSQALSRKQEKSRMQSRAEKSQGFSSGWKSKALSKTSGVKQDGRAQAGNQPFSTKLKSPRLKPVKAESYKKSVKRDEPNGASGTNVRAPAKTTAAKRKVNFLKAREMFEKSQN